jgi:Fe-S-cluster containining protein
MLSSSPDPLPQETARIHLHVLGEEHTVCVPLPLGERTVFDLLPAARALTATVTEAALEQARRQGRSISCRAGCGACCRQLVVISQVEARALADLVAAMPAERQAVIRARFAAALRRLEEAGLLDPTEPRGGRALLGPDVGSRQRLVWEVATRYYRQQIPCPFLENESCSIYEDRPLVCREYHVTSPPECCAHLDEGGVEKVLPPVHLGDVLACTAGRATATSEQTLPLVLSLEWAETHGAALDAPRDGMGLFQAMMAELDQQYRTAFDRRDAAPGMAGP